MKRKKAFTLLELMIYLSLTVGLLYAVFAFFSSSYKNFFTERTFCTQVVRDSIVLDVLKRDLISASMHPADWHLQECIFKQETLTKQGLPREVWIGWRTVPHGVYRTKGIYDSTSKQWLSKRSYFFPCSLTELYLFLHFDKQQLFCVMVEVKYRVGKRNKAVQEFVPLRNKII